MKFSNYVFAKGKLRKFSSFYPSKIYSNN